MSGEGAGESRGYFKSENDIADRGMGRGGGGRGGRGRGRGGPRGGGQGGGYNRGGGGGAGGGGRGGDGGRRGGGGQNSEYWSNNGGGVDDGGFEGGDGMNMGGHHGFMPVMDKMTEKLMTMAGPTYDLQPLEAGEKKFSGRSRLYIGNISSDATEEEIKEPFAKYGETAEFFLNRERNFAFIKLDYFRNAEKAKRELDGFVLKGKNLRIRFAPGNATIKVKNMSPYVSNELLHMAFSLFGDVEKATVLMDERGKPTGEGIVEFARKGAANHAIRRCTERCFFLTNSLKPVVVEPYEFQVDNDGLEEKSLQKRQHDYMRAREMGPRFADPNSFEHDYGSRWKELYDLYHEKKETLKKELQMEMEKLEAQQEFARYEHETAMLRDQLRQREMDRERQKQEWEMKERMMEEQRRRHDDMMRRRTTQESNMFMQAHKLTSLLDQQEQPTFDFQQPPIEPGMGNVGGYSTGEPKPLMGGNADGVVAGGGEPNEAKVPSDGVWAEAKVFDTAAAGGGAAQDATAGNAGGHTSRWGQKERRDSFQQKRRRF